MILATKSGWLISCKFLRETKKARYVEIIDKPKKSYRVLKDSETHRLFNNIEDALDWQGVKL